MTKMRTQTASGFMARSRAIVYAILHRFGSGILYAPLREDRADGMIVC